MPDLAWLPTVLAGLLGVVIGSRLNEAKGYREKVWDKRAKAYSEILEAVGEMEELLERWWVIEVVDIKREKAVGENETALFQAAKERVLRTIWRENWVLPARDVERLEKFSKQLHEKHGSYVEHLDGAGFACRSLIKDLSALARKEMVEEATSNWKLPIWRRNR